MLRDITLGQYYPGNSWVHSLDARIKITATIVYIVALFIVDTFYGFASGVPSITAWALSITITLSHIEAMSSIL